MNARFTLCGPGPSTPRSREGPTTGYIDTNENASTGRQEEIMADLLEEIDRLIERSSLGAPDAKSLRDYTDRTSPDAVRQILDRVDSLNHGPFTVGIEILPYEVIGVLTDHHGELSGVRRSQLPNMTVHTVVEHVARIARDLVATSLGLDLPNANIGIGLQLGGPINTRTGTVLFYSNHPTDPTTRRPHTDYMWRWRGEKLAELVEQATGCRTVLENDANALAIYEQKFGVGQEVGSYAVVLVRDGIGCALIADNKLLPGQFEFGHIIIWPEGRLCDCQKRGCIESQAGRRATRAVVRELTETSVDLEWEAAVRLAQGEGDQAEKALNAFKLAGESIARGIATLMTLLGPTRVVIYGPEELIEAGKGNRVADAFIEAVKTFDQFAFHSAPRCELVTRPLGPTNGAHGAALIALQRLFSVRLTSTSPKWSTSDDFSSPAPRREAPSDPAGHRT
jgi:glucokinase